MSVQNMSFLFDFRLCEPYDPFFCLPWHRSGLGFSFPFMKETPLTYI